jgi:hypothetical protein
MSRLEQRAVIRYLILRNLNVAELQSVDAQKYSKVSKGRLRFQDGRDDPFDLAHSATSSRSDFAAPIVIIATISIHLM